MKRITAVILFIAIHTLMVPFVSAKNEKGVYLTAKDFADKKLSYEHNSKIHLNNSVLELPYITVVDSSKTVKLKKGEVFAYADGNNHVYRFYKNKAYLIAEAGPITIYAQYEPVAQSRGSKVKESFYFSTKMDGAMIPLTLSNVMKAYRSNNQFLDLLDQYFSNGGVSAFDAIHNMYKLNYVYGKGYNK